MKKATPWVCPGHAVYLSEIQERETVEATPYFDYFAWGNHYKRPKYDFKEWNNGWMRGR